MKRMLALIGCFVGWALSINAQTPTREQLVGTWIGVHTEWDVDFFCPLPTYIQLKSDSSYHLGVVDGSAPAQVSTWSLQGDSVRLDTIRFQRGLVTIQDSLLRIGALDPMVFRRFNDVKADSASIHKQLVGKTWQSDSLTVFLYPTGRVYLQNRSTGRKTAHFWRLAQFQKSVFLVIWGNKHSQDGGYKPLWQIVNVSREQFKAIGWNGRIVATESFRLIDAVSDKDTTGVVAFQPCSNCFDRRFWYGWPSNESQSWYDAKQIMINHFRPIDELSQSGLIRLQFVDNCHDDRGLFEIQGWDEDYCPKKFSSLITDQLITICRQHLPKDWLTEPNEEPYDKAVTLTFRLKNGHITDLLP